MVVEMVQGSLPHGVNQVDAQRARNCEPENVLAVEVKKLDHFEIAKVCIIAVVWNETKTM